MKRLLLTVSRMKSISLSSSFPLTGIPISKTHTEDFCSLKIRMNALMGPRAAFSSSVASTSCRPILNDIIWVNTELILTQKTTPITSLKYRITWVLRVALLISILKAFLRWFSIRNTDKRSSTPTLTAIWESTPPSATEDCLSLIYLTIFYYL